MPEGDWTALLDQPKSENLKKQPDAVSYDSPHPINPELNHIAVAQDYARGIEEVLSDACVEFALAGALRRGAVEVGADGYHLEFVVAPKLANAAEGFSRDLLVETVEGLDTAGECRILQAAPFRESRLHALEFPWGRVHLWLANPQSFGSILLYKTGPDSHIHSLMSCAQRQHLCWMPYQGLITSNSIIGETEEAIYHTLGLAVIPPQERKGELPCA
jgi:DNA polymerase/3'-5' exonuclease PolX